MKCERRDLAIAKLAGGDLSPRQTDRVRRHLNECTRCRALFDELVEQREASCNAFADTSLSVVDSVLNRIAKENPPERQPSAARRAIALAPVLCIALLVASIAVTERWFPAPAQEIQSAAATPEIAPAPSAEPFDYEPARSDVVIRLVTDNPDVAIYWLGDSAGGM